MNIHELTVVTTHTRDLGIVEAYAETLHRMRASGVGTRHLKWLEAALERARERVKAGESAYRAVLERRASGVATE